jgi:hypothetical protein
MIKVLSLEPERSMLGFSREVAREVTHPEWPSRVPLRMSCSVMLSDRLHVAQSICDVNLEEVIQFKIMKFRVGESKRTAAAVLARNLNGLDWRGSQMGDIR